MSHVPIPDDFVRAWPKEIIFSTGRSKRTNDYQRQRGTAEEFIAHITDHCAGEKEGSAWSPFHFKDDMRRAENCIGADVLCLDIDDGTPWSEGRAKLFACSYAAVVATSYSHESTRTHFPKKEFDKWREDNPRDNEENFMRTRKYRRAVWRGSKIARGRDEEPLIKHIEEDGKVVEKITIEHAPCPKLRIIVPLVEPFRVADYHGTAEAADAWRRMCCALANTLGLKIDPSALLLTQLFFDPRHPTGVTPVVRLVRGRALDLAALAIEIDAKGVVAPDRGDPRPAPSPGRQSRSTAILFNGDVEVLRSAVMAIPHDDRIGMNTWVAIIGAIHDETDGSDEGRELAHEWSATWVKGYDEGETEGVWQRATSNSETTAVKAGGKTIRFHALNAGWEPPQGWRWPDRAGVLFADERDEQETIDEFNEEFAVIKNRGAVRVLCEDKDATGLDTFDLLSERDFRLLTRNRGAVVTTDAKGNLTRAPAGVVWLNSLQRREYRAIVFRPGEELRTVDGSNGHPRFYNLWRGWGVTAARTGACVLFLEHLRENVCNGDIGHFNWLLDWIAHIFQKSCQKPSVAVVLIGDKGTGKSIVGKVLGALIGRHHYFVLSQPQQLLGKFNAHLASALLIQAEEAFFSLNPETRGILKDLISRETRSVEPKGVDAYMVDAYDRLLITSNEDAVVPAEPGERRYFVCRLSNRRAKDTAYFAAIDEQMKNGGYERLLYELLNRDLRKFDCRTAPVTSALREQTRQHMPPVAKWAFDALADETFWLMNDDWYEARREQQGAGSSHADYDPLAHGRIISKQAVRHHFSAYCRRLNLKSHMTDSDFGKWLTEHLGFRSVQRRTGDVRREGGRDRTRLYQIPSIADARERFCRKLNIDSAMIADAEE